MSYKERVRQNFTSLTQSQKKVAEYLLSNPSAFALDKAATIANTLGVSGTTVIRFCYALNYSGFSELQREVKESLVLEKNTITHHQETTRKYEETSSFLMQVMNQDIDHIQQTISNLREDDFQAAVENIIQAEHLVIVGIRASFPAAHWLASVLNVHKGNTKLFNPSTDDLVALSTELNATWTVIAISFKRYAKETIDMVQIAKKSGAYVIAITDDLLSPISQMANTVLQIPIHFTLDVTPALFSLLNAMVSAISVKDKKRVAERIKKYEQYYEQVYHR